MRFGARALSAHLYLVYVLVIKLILVQNIAEVGTRVCRENILQVFNIDHSVKKKVMHVIQKRIIEINLVYHVEHE